MGTPFFGVFESRSRRFTSFSYCFVAGLLIVLQAVVHSKNVIWAIVCVNIIEVTRTERMPWKLPQSVPKLKTI